MNVIKRLHAACMLVLCLFANANGQQHPVSRAFTDSIYARTQACAPRIRAAIIKWGKTEGISLTPSSREWLLDSIKLVPIVKLTLETGPAGGYIPQFSTDSLFDICALVYPSRRVYIYTPAKDKLGLKGPAAGYMSALATHSSTLTARPLFVYLFSIERHWTDITGWIDPAGSLKFLVKDTAMVYDIEGMLTQKYGAAATYFEYRRREKVKQEIRDEALRTLSYDSIKYSWQFHTEYFPKDTAGSVQLLLNDIRAVTQATENQLDSIRQQVMTHLRTGVTPGIIFSDTLQTYFRYFGQSPYIFFKSIDLTPILTRVLDNTQFARYKRRTEVADFRKKRIESILFVKFKGDSQAVHSFIRSHM